MCLVWLLVVGCSVYDGTRRSSLHTRDTNHKTPQLDARAHNIDLQAKKEAELKKEWESFLKFATQVRSSCMVVVVCGVGELLCCGAVLSYYWILVHIHVVCASS